MSADMHIHVYKDGSVPEEIFELFFSNTFGAKYSRGFLNLLTCREKDTNEKQLLEKYRDIDFPGREDAEYLFTDEKDHYIGIDHYWIMALDNVWVGEVSWLKAMVFDDTKTFVPDVVGTISDIFHDHPFITEGLIFQVEKAYSVINTTGYSIAEEDEVINFLKKNVGKRGFTVSW